MLVKLQTLPRAPAVLCIANVFSAIPACLGSTKATKCNIKVAYFFCIIINCTFCVGVCVGGGVLCSNTDALNVRHLAVITSLGLSAQAGQVSSGLDGLRQGRTQVWTSDAGNLGHVCA